MVSNIINNSSIPLDFNQARARHLLFKTNLRSILYGAEINNEPILSQFDCGVGKWIYGHALEQYGHLPEMHRLEKVHADIHTCARDLVAKYNKGFTEEARNGLGTMEDIADELISLLDTIEIKINAITGLPPLPENNTDDLKISYNELQELYKTVKDLDQRIKEQTLISNSARKLAEANENKFRSTVMQAPVSIVIMRGEEMVVEMTNNTYLDIIDMQLNDIIGHRAFDLFPELKDTMLPLFLNVYRTGEPFYGNEYKVTINRYGKREEAYFNFIYSALREPDNSISGLIGVGTEVTEQVKNKIALDQKDAQFRNLVSKSPIAMAIFRGEDLIVELANETLLKNLWRKELKDVEGRKLMDIFPELSEQKFPELLVGVLKTGKIYQESEAFAIVNSDDGEAVLS